MKKKKFAPANALQTATYRNHYDGIPPQSWEGFEIYLPQAEHVYVGEWMTDTRGFLRNYFNPITHTKLNCNPLDGSGVKQLNWVVSPSSWGTPQCRLEIGGQGLFPTSLVEDVFRELSLQDKLPDLPGFLDDFSVRAEDHLVSAIRDTHSLANFLIELIQLCTGNIKKLSEWIEKYRKALKAFWKMYEETGNYWLAWNFCIKPTIKDLKEILQAAKKSLKRLEWLRQRNHKPTIVHYRQGPYKKDIDLLEWPMLESDINQGSICDYPGSSKFKWRARDLSIRMSPAAHANVRWDIDDQLLNSPLGRFFGWATISGFMNPVDIVWEATPFSWLLDWFLSKRAQAIKDLGDISPFADATVIQAGHSLKWIIQFNLCWTTYKFVPFVGEVEEERVLAPCRIIFYRRIPELPKYESSYFRIPLEWYNLSILAALVQQSRRRRK